ncbi:hypothetical protein PIB30_060687 [Stylosanthes scabra]|uniref:Uncharacterized protein n=1 Tax=Stylosanthes scabra TaxID=79078 RepID=A0ABU6SLN8_9FABA|nr:hypothetical protein [Stylosanthes scabra]
MSIQRRKPQKNEVKKGKQKIKEVEDSIEDPVYFTSSEEEFSNLEVETVKTWTLGDRLGLATKKEIERRNTPEVREVSKPYDAAPLYRSKISSLKKIFVDSIVSTGVPGVLSDLEKGVIECNRKVSSNKLGSFSVGVENRVLCVSMITTNPNLDGLPREELTTLSNGRVVRLTPIRMSYIPFANIERPRYSVNLNNPSSSRP